MRVITVLKLTAIACILEVIICGLPPPALASAKLVVVNTVPIADPLLAADLTSLLQKAFETADGYEARVVSASGIGRDEARPPAFIVSSQLHQEPGIEILTLFVTDTSSGNQQIIKYTAASVESLKATLTKALPSEAATLLKSGNQYHPATVILIPLRNFSGTDAERDIITDAFAIKLANASVIPIRLSGKNYSDNMADAQTACRAGAQAIWAWDGTVASEEQILGIIHAVSSLSAYEFTCSGTPIYTANSSGDKHYWADFPASLFTLTSLLTLLKPKASSMQMVGAVSFLQGTTSGTRFSFKDQGLRYERIAVTDAVNHIIDSYCAQKGCINNGVNP